jgi:hypothetical protein
MPQEECHMPTDFERVEPGFGDGPIQPPSRTESADPPTDQKSKSAAPSKKAPLSQAPGKKKLLVGIPMAAVSGGAYLMGLGSLAQMFFIAFLAYAVVGLIEVILGASLVRAGEAWERLDWWQKGLASVVVILGALVLFINLMPLFAP